MEDLQTAYIRLPPDYMTKQHVKIKKDLAHYKLQMLKEYEELKSTNKFIFENWTYDESGEARISINNLSDVEKRLMENIIKNHPSVNFFKIKDNILHNRQQVYYSVHDKEDRLYQAMKTFIYLDTNLVFLQELNPNDFVSGSFIIASILDDIRYKLILLFEDVLTNKISVNTNKLEAIVEESIWIYYSYLLGRPQTTIGYSQLLQFANDARYFIATEYLNSFNPSAKKLRDYKEGDVPSDNLLFINKLKKSLPNEEIHLIVGIPFSGIELPYLIKRFIYPKAKIKLIRVSNYSSGSSNEFGDLNNNDFKGKNILIVDDGITTGRTIEKIIEYIKSYCQNVYFACIYFSGPKRFKQMQMPNHGGFNVEQLKKCCVLKETNYTASENKLRYTNSKGNFDKTKTIVKAKANLGQTLFDINVPVENIQQKESNTKKVFMVCSKSYITENYDNLMRIRNAFQTNSNYELVDDWLKERVINQEYKEKEGRNVLKDAVRDISKANLIILFYPYPSTFTSLLFLASVNMKKEIWIYYSHKEDLKGFEFYPHKKVFQIMQLKSSLALI